ncbi:MAG: nuclear transport factor 2 family protein [Candidatus Omnitrophica bacterium]|nr:nuclear transport factor 2 family protein [Candidatus Omnitrophota bacterium]MCB9720408.1 nuclear transport factor 2 family protein [Candidatus Omnitrophota bacterium]
MSSNISVVSFFKELNKDSMHLVDEFYDRNVLFRDPLVEIRGREGLRAYYDRLYRNVKEIDFDITYVIQENNNTALAWKMMLRADNFNGNKPLTVDGSSVIKFGGTEGKAVYHRDYFDLGEFVYEGIPVLGRLVRFVKGKMAQHHGAA